MANEIIYNVSIGMTNGGVEDSASFSNKYSDQATAIHTATVQAVPTSYTDIEWGEVVTPGWAMFKNLDSTNYVEIGRDDGFTTFFPFLRLKAGESAWVKLASFDVKIQANTSPVEVFYRLLEY